MPCSKNPLPETKIKIDFIESHPEISISQLAEIFNLAEKNKKIDYSPHGPARRMPTNDQNT